MDFFSRDHYLRTVEKLALRSGQSEEGVAQQAVELARQAGSTQAATAPSAIDRNGIVRSHVGYYLAGPGRQTLEEQIGYQPEWKERLARVASRARLGFYLGAIFVAWWFFLAATWIVAAVLQIDENIGPMVYSIMVILSGGLAAQFAVSLINWICTLFVPPRPMMRLDFSRGIPDTHRMLVAVPTMLTSPQAVRQLVRQLEVRYAANRDENLLFALVTDFPDAAEETMPDDESLLDIACAEIKRLNEQYCRNRPSHFYLLHRSRKWNSAEGVWMGEERKRGKLAALNRLLQIGDAAAFSATVGDLNRLGGVRYVITLDTDTQLPHDAGQKLVGRMAHPLNWAKFDARTRRIVAGYAILQPRVGVTFPEANRSLFSRLLAGDAGIDPYTGQTSYLYHDVFAESSYIGKGIYEVEMFEKAIAGRFPDNRILSHDLIESCFASCGFANDVDLFEGVPSRFLADSNRRHRWIRGDWQIAAWLMPKVPRAHGKSANPLSWLSRWKIFDNLRRSVTPICQLGFLLLGWAFAPAHTLFWMLLAVMAISGLPCLTAGWGVLHKPPEKPWLLHFKDQGALWLRGISAETLAWCVLPYTAYCNFDAIARVLYRLRVSKRKNLEWTTSCEVESRCNYDLAKHYQVMWPCVVVSLAVITMFGLVYPLALLAASPLLIGWLAGPWIAWRISQPLATDATALTENELRQLRRWARRTWHYFELHANGKTHGLPPDNVQEDLLEPVVCNTSPTNIGLGLVSGVAAHDFGYLTASSLLKRTSCALETMRRLKRYRGHFFNWYDLRTLEPLEPRFVSSVDSGNLWASLVALRGGLEELHDRPLISPRLMEGLQDTLDVIAAMSEAAQGDIINARFKTILSQLRERCCENAGGARQAYKLLNTLRKLAVRLDGLVQPREGAALIEPLGIAGTPCVFAFSASPLEHHSVEIAPSSANALPTRSADLKRWTQSLVRQITEAKRELAQLAFWVHFPLLPPPQNGSLPFSQDLDDLYDRLRRLNEHCLLSDLPEAAKQVADGIDRILKSRTNEFDASANESHKLLATLKAMRRAARKAASAVRHETEQISLMTNLCEQFCQMDFRFLFNPHRQLLSIGFNASMHRLEQSYYDLMASESRLTSFLAVSHGQLPLDHWFALGRMADLPVGKPMLLSWSGSMFEYLMPSLFLPSYPGTIIETSCRTAAIVQIRHAQESGMPWGISESCYHLTDENRFYQYRAFGVPGLSVQQTHEDHGVVAPYASAIAVQIAPHEVCENLLRLEGLGCLGPCGFYDAIDYTPRRRLSNGQPALCRIVMAHHSGMTLLAFANALLDNVMTRRFLRDPFCEAHNVLLQERIPQMVKPYKRQKTLKSSASVIPIMMPKTVETAIKPLPQFS